MSYIKPHMVQSLSKHRLCRVPLGNTDRACYYVMSKPDTGDYLVKIACLDRQIVITGDICLGSDNGRGVVSTLGYSLDWFASRLSESYLCEKFLSRTWQWEAARDTLEDWIANSDDYDIPSDHCIKFQKMLSSGCEWVDEQLTEQELYEQLSELSQGYVDDGVPGYDYPRADAGWLCAMQQRFATLVSEREVVPGFCGRVADFVKKMIITSKT